MKNEGVDCWDSCNGQQGPCDWCGAGVCCRYGWDDKSNGCDGSIGYPGMGHVCAPRPSDHEAEFSYKGLTVNIAGESDGGSGSGSGSGSDPADDEDFDAGYGACYTYAFENEGFCVKDNACHACAASCADECSSSSSFNVVHVHVHPSAAFDMEVLGEG